MFIIKFFWKRFCQIFRYKQSGNRKRTYLEKVSEKVKRGGSSKKTKGTDFSQNKNEYWAKKIEVIVTTRGAFVEDFI